MTTMATNRKQVCAFCQVAAGLPGLQPDHRAGSSCTENLLPQSGFGGEDGDWRREMNDVKCENVDGKWTPCVYKSHLRWVCEWTDKYCGPETVCKLKEHRERELCRQLGITPEQLAKAREEEGT